MLGFVRLLRHERVIEVVIQRPHPAAMPSGQYSTALRLRKSMSGRNPHERGLTTHRRRLNRERSIILLYNEVIVRSLQVIGP